MCVIAVNSKMPHQCVMAADDPHFRLRIPAALKARIEEAAHAKKRSINAEIVDRLDRSFAATTSRNNDEVRAIADLAATTASHRMAELVLSLLDSGAIENEASRKTVRDLLKSMLSASAFISDATLGLDKD
jgi:hypothetical protein